MSDLAPAFRQQFFDNNGLPLAGGQIWTYAAGTTTPLATYTDQSGVTPNANPVILDSAGQAKIWISAASYKFILEDSLGNIIETLDNVSNPSSASGVSSFNSLSGAVVLAAGSNITLTPLGNTITVASGGAAWGAITGTLSSQTDLNTALGLKAPLASPTFTGTVTSPAFSGPLTGNVTGNATTVTTNANLTGPITSVGNTTSIASQTGTGSKFVVDTTPTLVTPIIGAATGTSLSVTGQLTSTVATGTAPLVITSTTPVSNLVCANINGTTNATLTTASALTSVGAIATGTWNATTVAIAHGGTAVTSVTTAPAASSFAGWDANKNLSANAMIEGFTTTATAAGTTTMTIASTKTQYWTGVTTQTVKLPTTSVVAGGQYFINNLSTGVVSIQSSGANAIVTLSQNTGALFTALIATPTTAANWDFEMTPSPAGSSSGNLWTSTGATSAPTWQAPSGTSPTGSYAQAYFSSLTAQWSTVSATMADFTLAAGANTLTVRKSSGITLTAAASSLPGITFTPANASAVYWITASASFGNSATTNYLYLQLTDGSSIIASNPGINSGNTNADSGSTTIGGVYVPGTASAVTVKLQGAVSAGTGFVGVQTVGSLAGSAAIEWTVVRIF